MDSETVKLIEDELFLPALEYIAKTGNASCVSLQLKFSISYPRAKRFIDAAARLKNKPKDLKALLSTNDYKKEEI